MILIHKYRIAKSKQGLEECRSQERETVCPKCNQILLYRDRRKRTYRNKKGEKKIILIRRLKCAFCKQYHNELPDFLLPYKQCIAETVEVAVAENGFVNNSDSEDVPDLLTIKRWRRWIEKNIIKINSNIQSYKIQNIYISKYIPHNTDTIQIQEIMKKGRGWLSALIDLCLLNEECT